MPVRYKPSDYNHAISFRDELLIFNGVSSALVRLDAKAYRRLRPYLFGRLVEPNGPQVSDPPGTTFRPPVFGNKLSFDLEIEPPHLRSRLLELAKANYIVEESVDEIAYLRDRYRRHQKDAPLFVTVVTTMDCNLACYYCYEKKYASYLSVETCDRIFGSICQDLREHSGETMHLAWFGGEPMLNREAIEYLSGKLVSHCSATGIRYAASMVSNGTLWPAGRNEATAFVTRNRVGTVQFTFDGLRGNHNARRHYRDGNRNHQLSSFDALCATIEAIRGSATIYLRLNVDRGNESDVNALIDYFDHLGWFAPGSKIYPYLAPLRPYSQACRHVEKTAMALNEFDLKNNAFRERLSKHVDLRKFAWAHYPRSLPLNCSAVAQHTMIFGPDGEAYKCYHDIGVQGAGKPPVVLPNRAEIQAAAHDYVSFEPFSNSTCLQCRYLPNCLGGCPKLQMEDPGQPQLSLCQYWEISFEQMICTFAGSDPDSVSIQVS